MEDIKKIKEDVIKIFKKSKIHLKQDEVENLEITDLGLGNFYDIGLSLIVYINTNKICAKEIALLPNQTCAQHRHPPVKNSPGKEETFRCKWGEVYLYVDGLGSKYKIKAKIPVKYKDKFTVFKEIILKPGDQYTLEPNIWHWFQAGPKGAVISEFSTHSTDANDIFYDKETKRVAVDN